MNSNPDTLEKGVLSFLYSRYFSGGNFMETQHNKQMAHEFYRCFSESNITGVMATMTDDATYWIAGKPQSGVPCGS